MTGRAYIGEVLIQVWLKSIVSNKQSECIKRENFQGSHKLLQAHEKCAKQRNKIKQSACKNVFNESQQFISHIQRIGEKDLNELQVNDS